MFEEMDVFDVIVPRCREVLDVLEKGKEGEELSSHDVAAIIEGIGYFTFLANFCEEIAE